MLAGNIYITNFKIKQKPDLYLINGVFFQNAIGPFWCPIHVGPESQSHEFPFYKHGRKRSQPKKRKETGMPTNTTDKESKRVNGIDVDTLMGTVNAVKSDPELGRCKFRATNKWSGGAHNCTTVKAFHAAKQNIDHKQKFELHCDEPAILAGADDGANPVEHLLNALAGCVTTSMVAHAAVRGIEIQELESELEGDIDLRGFFGLADVPKGFTEIRVKFKMKADKKDLDEIKSLASFSPVYNTLTSGTKVDIQVELK
jgi:uncharacterized OsmC-like protein